MVAPRSTFAARNLRAVCILAPLFVLSFVADADVTTPNPVSTAVKPVGIVSANSGKTASKPIAKPTWAELTPAQQQALAPLSNEWDKLDPSRKKKWLEIAKKYSTMKPEDQLRLQTRMSAWAKLTPEQRRVARENYARTKKLNADQKAAQWQQYQQLPEDQKKKLATDAASKKQVANLPSAKSRHKTVAPIKSTQKPKPLLVQPVTPPATPVIRPATQAVPQSAPAAPQAPAQAVPK